MREIARIFGHFRFHEERADFLYANVCFALMDICEPPSAIGEKGRMDCALIKIGRIHTVRQREEGEEGAALAVQMDRPSEVRVDLLGCKVQDLRTGNDLFARETRCVRQTFDRDNYNRFSNWFV